MRERDTATVRRLALALILITTAIPTGFRRPRFSRRLRANPLDFVLNVALYIPFGFGFGKGGLGSTITRGAALTCLIEGAQAFYRGRFGALMDIIANTAGTAVGAVIFRIMKASDRGIH